MRNYSKLIVMLAFLAVIAGCVTEETYYMADPGCCTWDARIVGNIHGVVRDGANNALLPGVEVQLTRGDLLLVRTTSSHGHYSFANLVPGRYTLTFVYPNSDEKAVAHAYAAGVNRQEVPDWDDLGWTWTNFDDKSQGRWWEQYGLSVDRDFVYEIVADMLLYPLLGNVRGKVISYRPDRDDEPVPVAGVTVVADYACQYLVVNQYFAQTNQNGEYEFRNLPAGMKMCCPGSYDYGFTKSLPLPPDDGDIDQWGHWGEMPDCMVTTLRTQTYMDTELDRVLIAEPVDLNMQWAAHPDAVFLADDLILRSAYAPRIVMRNFGSFDPNNPETLFPLASPFVAQFNVPMEPSTFVAELQVGGGKGADWGEIVPVTQSWSNFGTGHILTVTQHQPLLPNTRYKLTLEGSSAILPHRFHGEWIIRTTSPGTVRLVSRNFSDINTDAPPHIPFAVDDPFELRFNTFMREDDFAAYLYKEGDKATWLDVMIDVDGNVVTIDPVHDLVINTTYELDVLGYSLGGMQYAQSFGVQTLQTDLPVVTHNNFENVAGHLFPIEGEVFSTRFDMPMDLTGFDVRLQQKPNFNDVPVTTPTSPDGGWTVHFSSVDPLDFNTEFLLTISGHSVSGLPFGPRTFDVKTISAAMPRIVSKNYHQHIYIHRDHVFWAEFNMPMDPDRFIVALMIDGDPNKTEARIVFIDDPWWVGNRVYVQPTFLLDPDTKYWLRLTGFSQNNQPYPANFDGNNPLDGGPNLPAPPNPPVNNPETWRFWYGPLPTTQVPNYPNAVATLENLSPVPLDAHLNVAFSIPVLTETVEMTFTRGAVPVLFDHQWVDDQHLTLMPLLPLESGSEHQITVQGRSILRTPVVMSPNPNHLVFRTVDYQAVHVIADNLLPNFPVEDEAGEVVPLFVAFSTVMDPQTFTTPYDGLITLTRVGGSIVPISYEWSPASAPTALSITPLIPLQERANYRLRLVGQAENGNALTYGSHWPTPPPAPPVSQPVTRQFRTYDPEGVFVIANNVVSGDFDIDQDLEFTFSHPMDPGSVVVRLDGIWLDINGAVSWNEPHYTVMTFDPDLVLVPLPQPYKFGINGLSQDGGQLTGVGSYNHVPNVVWPQGVGPFDYQIEFETRGGLEFLYHNIFTIDGTDTNVDRNIVMALHFNAPDYGEVLHLNHPDHDVRLTHGGSADARPNLAHFADRPRVGIHYNQPEDGLLHIWPQFTNDEGQPELDPSTWYLLEFIVFTRLAGDETGTIGPHSYDDPPPVASAIPAILFRTQPAYVLEPVVEPVDEGTIELDYPDDPTWEVNFNTLAFNLIWGPVDNATGYRVYARNDDAKADYVLVAEIEDETSTTVNLAAGVLADHFDTRPDDDVQTPFDRGRKVHVAIAGFNDLGEGPWSGDFTLQDTTRPTGGDLLMNVPDMANSADNSTGATPLYYYFQYTSDENLGGYLHHNPLPLPVVHIIPGVDNPALIGDPNYQIDTSGLTAADFRYEDNDNGTTTVTVRLTVAPFKNGAGDYVRVTGWRDTSGNLYLHDADNPAPGRRLPDNTPPFGGEFLAWTGSADNSNPNVFGVDDDMEFTLRYNATELLRHDVLTIGIIAGVEDEDNDQGGRTDHLIGLANIETEFFDVLSEDPGTPSYTYIEITGTVPAGSNFAGDKLKITGLLDRAGNPYDDDEDTTPVFRLEDHTEPWGEITQNDPLDDADNSGGVEPKEIEFTITSTELLAWDEDNPSVNAPVLRLYNASGVHQPNAVFVVGNDPWEDIPAPPATPTRTTYTFAVQVPINANYDGYSIRYNGTVDLAGNVQTVESDPVFLYDLAELRMEFRTSAQSGSADNSHSASARQVRVRAHTRFGKKLDTTVDPVINIINETSPGEPDLSGHDDFWFGEHGTSWTHEYDTNGDFIDIIFSLPGYHDGSFDLLELLGLQGINGQGMEDHPEHPGGVLEWTFRDTTRPIATIQQDRGGVGNEFFWIRASERLHEGQTEANLVVEILDLDGDVVHTYAAGTFNIFDWDHTEVMNIPGVPYTYNVSTFSIELGAPPAPLNFQGFTLRYRGLVDNESNQQTTWLTRPGINNW